MPTAIASVRTEQITNWILWSRL